LFAVEMRYWITVDNTDIAVTVSALII